MSVRLSVALSEGMAARVREQAELECRSVSNMLERLVVLGLAAVVTERDLGIAKVPEGVAAQDGKLQQGLRPDPASRSVTAGPERMPVSGGLVMPGRDPGDLLATNKSAGPDD